MTINPKYKPHYTFSKDSEELEVKITAKRLGNNYYMEIPSSWVINEDKKLISVNKCFFENLE